MLSINDILYFITGAVIVLMAVLLGMTLRSDKKENKRGRKK